MTLSLASLVAANLIPLVGVFFFGWEVGPILLLYWSENLVVGGYNVLKVMVRPAEHPLSIGAGSFRALSSVFITERFVASTASSCWLSWIPTASGISCRAVTGLFSWFSSRFWFRPFKPFGVSTGTFSPGLGWHWL